MSINEILYQNIDELIKVYWQLNNLNLGELTIKLFPMIQQFMTEYFEKKPGSLEQSVYDARKEQLNNVLEDIVSGVENKDDILILDALQSGLQCIQKEIME